MKKPLLIILGIIAIIFILSTVAVVLTYITDSQLTETENAKLATINIFDTNYVSKQQITIENGEITNDYDSDGLTNQEELFIGTDIHIKDTDSDGLTDYQENSIYMSNPLEQYSGKDKVKDGVKVFYGYKPTDTLPKDIINKEEILSNDSLGVSIKTSDIDTRVFNKIYAYIPNLENINIYKGFYLFNVNKAQVEVTKTADMTEEIKVFYFNEIKNEPIEINYKIKEDKIQFSVNKPEFPILITSINEYNQLVKRNYVLIKSNSFLFNGFRIYERSTSLSAEEDVVQINPEDVELNGLKLTIKNVGAIKGFIYDRIGSFLKSSNFGISAEKLYMSRQELIDYLTKKEGTFNIGKDTFFINNFSTDLNRKSHAAGLSFIPAYFKTREIPLEQNYTFEEFRKTTSFDFGRDVEAYEKIFNKKFGEYTFKYSVPEKASIDIIENPDKQVYKFIEMYNNFFFSNRESFKIKKMKNYDEALASISQTIENDNFFVIGFNNKQKGHFLLGYDISSKNDASILKIKVYDPNIYSNKINGKDINNTIYLSPKVETIVTDKGVVSQYTQYNYIYDPVNSKDYCFDNNNYEIEFFNKF